MAKQTESNGGIKGLANFTSTLMRRLQLAARAGITYDGNRDLYKALGYKRTLTFDDYYDRYERGDIAARIVDAFPLATWRNPPIVKAKKKHPTFDNAWLELNERLSIYHYLERIDRLSGVGQYAVLLLGFSGASSLENSPSKGADLIYLSPFYEKNAEIRHLSNNPTDPRYALPDLYQVNLGTILGREGNATIFNKDVHWSRVLHVAEGLAEDEVFGCPRMKKVWNKLDDLDKVLGGSSEGVWRTVDRGIQFDVDKDMELTAEDAADFTAEIEEYVHDQKKYLRTKGITAKVLGSDLADPTGAFGVLLSIISGATGIPQRILLGAEVGQLASTQDERNFNARIKERQENYAGPQILRPFIKRLIDLDILPNPRGGFEFEWPDLSTQTLKDKADVAARVGQAIGNVSQQGKDGNERLITVDEFRKKYLGLDEPIPKDILASDEERRKDELSRPKALPANQPQPDIEDDG